MRHRAKLYQNRSHGRRDTAILRFSKWRRSAILDLWNSIFSTVGEVKRPILHQRTKFRKDWSNHYGDIAIFVIFKIAAASCWIFKNSKFQRPVPFFSLVRCGRLSRLLSAFERTLKSHLVSYRRAYDADSARRPTAVCLHSTSSVLTGQRPRGPSRRRRRPASTRVPADSTRTARETRRHQTPRWRPRPQNGTTATTTTFQVPFSFCLFIPSVYSYPCHLR